jgi:hypothetical protein
LTEEGGPEKTPFLPLLAYVLGFMLVLGLLAFALVWLLRR